MTTLLLIIYIAFISLGLPDSLLGSAWPIMRVDLSAQLDVAGYVMMAVTAGTIVSSLLSNRLTTRFGTGRVTLISVALTALALYGYSWAPGVPWLFVMAVPMGLGAGSVDAALNNFVALHYKSRHMSWLHCFWGIGATVGPAIMSLFLLAPDGWRRGFMTIAFIQTAVVLLLLVSQPLWKKAVAGGAANDADAGKKLVTNREALRIPYVKLALVSFAFFSATELTTGLWSSSYLVSIKGLPADRAALWTGYFYAGITVGRFVSGLVTAKLKSEQLIRLGQWICVAGALLLLAPLPTIFSMVGIILMGLGTAPIFPSMLHETPNRFGANVSGAIMGLQMAFAYLGGTLMPPLFGAVAQATTLRLFPYFLLVYSLIMLAASESLNKKIARRTTEKQEQ